ncbi:hypothetical protein MMYC01_201085 [Madurella mycetomatis]|uniref:Stress-response A/B barrel domain-containing protein n=1 Tax=Madurella mycetomatis TaxID=100816 RepID=A0A175WG21_9PEZI|nr:hypothetical protein MMYC01_201085 [Madurella mycetomatis]
MSVTHTILFRFKADAKPEDVKAACDRFLALRETCLHPTSNSVYIRSLKGGKDNSPEGLQFHWHLANPGWSPNNKNGATHGFVVEFDSVEDRDYYVQTDPTHQAFVNSIGDLVEKAIVVDFVDGVY